MSQNETEKLVFFIASHKDLYPNAHEMCVQDAIYNANRTGEAVFIGRATYRVSPSGLVTALDTTLTDPSTTAFAQAMAKAEAEHNVTRAELDAARALITRYESAMRSSAATIRAVYPNADPSPF